MDERTTLSPAERHPGAPPAHAPRPHRSPRAGLHLPPQGTPPRFSTDQLIPWLLYALLLYLPWPFGSVEAWSEAIAMLLTGAIGLCLVYRFLAEKRPPIGSWTLVPPIAFAAFAALSMLPLPFGIASALSPRGVQIRADLLAPLAGQVNVSAFPLSFYPHATARMLRLVLSSTIVLTAVIQVCRTRRQITRLLAVIAAAGGLLAVETLLQDASSDNRIYWTLLAPVRSTSGPFINYNNFSQFMNLSVAAALALLLMALAAAQKAEAPLRHRTLVGKHWISKLVPLVLVGALAVILSTSRGGALALLAGGLTVAALLVLRRKSAVSLKALAVTALGLLMVVLAWGIDSVWNRMATLSDLETASGARWQVFHDVAAFVPQFLLTGIGLGTHEFVYPMFSHLTTWRNAQYVENEYLQLIEETGLAGVAIAAAFVALLAANLVTLLRRGKGPLVLAATGLTFGLVAVASGSVTDFGQRIISVSSLTAIIAGLLVAIRQLEVPKSTPCAMLSGAEKSLPSSSTAREAAEHARHTEPSSLARPRPAHTNPSPKITSSPPHLLTPSRIRLTLSLTLLAAVLWLLNGSLRAAIAEYHWNRALPLEQVLIKRSWQGTDQQFAALVAESSAAARWDPGKVEYVCWATIHRWHAQTRAAAWDAMTDAQRRATYDGLLKAFHQCEADCPTYGLAYAMAGQIRYLGLHDDGGIDEIHAAYRLAPTHPAVCFIAGRLSALQGQWDDAREEFGRAMALHYSRSEVLGVYLNEVHRPDLAAELFADDWESLYTIARSLAKDPAQAELAANIRNTADTVLTAASQKPDAPVQTLAAMADLLQQQNDFDGAVALYRRAIEANYGSPDLHLALARTLAAMGDTPQALAETGISLRLRPDNPPARQLLDQLSTPQE